MSLAASDFAFVAALVRTESAIVLDKGKEYLVESRLLPLARECGTDSIAGLVMALRTGNPSLKKRVVEALTTNETSFFRDGSPFDALRQQILPQLIERRRDVRTIRIWSAASSTGQEPYSIAMTMRESIPDLERWNVSIFATDIAADILARARMGVYSQLEVNRGLPAPLLVKYFQKRGADWCIKPEIMKMVKFEEFNLIRPWPPMQPFDIIFIRNVLIYFDLDIKRQILANMRKMLRPDGYLFLGGAETTLNVVDNFERVLFGRATAYMHRSGTIGKESPVPRPGTALPRSA